MKKKSIVIANCKMTMDLGQVERFFSRLNLDDSAYESVDVVTCPSFPFLDRVQHFISKRPIGFGAQNLYWEDRGAFTGEVSGRQLADIGCQYVILGHSERRGIFNEDDEMVNKKIQLALQNKLVPIICLGESYAEKEAGETKRVVEQHVRACLTGISSNDAKRVIIAYEPIWAISTSTDNVDGKGDSPESAQVVHKLIRKVVEELFDGRVAELVRIAYGGSVKPDNVGGFAAMDDIDGVLVGGASIEAGSFKKLVESFIVN